MKKLLKGLLCMAMILGVVGCAKEPEVETPVDTAYTAGTYEGEAEGRNGIIKVEVTVSADKIESAKVLEHVETAGIAEPAVEKIPERVVESQSLAVDVMAGATMTSESIIAALANALEKAGADIEKLKQPVSTNTEKKEDITTQVVVAGGGMAGLIAAATAVEEGAEVIVVEKLSQLGGSTLVASGAFAIAESETTSDLDDSVGKIIDYYKKINANSERHPNYDFLTTILNQTGEAVDFMVQELGLTGTGKDSNYVKFSFDGRGAGWVSNMEKAITSRGVKILLETEATELIMDGDKVVGVKVEDKGGEYNIHADKVILTTGGASWDKDRMLSMIPELNNVDLYERACIGNSGDSFKMVEAIGGDMYDDLWIKASAPEYADIFRFTSQTKPAITGQLIVDAEGKRFTNENPFGGSGVTTIEMIKHESSAYYALFDTVSITEDFANALKEHSAAEDKKIAIYGATIEELATKLGMEPATLKATFDKYQAACDAGVDEEFGKDASKLVKYAEKGGYYAVYQMPASYGTIGGSVTDEFGHVLKDGQPIPNLFAAGESSTYPLFGDYYVGAASLGLYGATGRIAAKTAVAEMSK